MLAAIAEAEAIEVSEEELVEALAHTAEHERTTPEKLLARLRENGRDAMVREDIAVRKAIDLVAESAKADPARAGRGPRENLDAGERERESRALDAGLRRLNWRASFRTAGLASRSELGLL